MPSQPHSLPEGVEKLTVCLKCGEACLRGLGCNGDPNLGHTGPFRTVEFAPVDACRSKVVGEVREKLARVHARHSRTAGESGCSFGHRSLINDLGDLLASLDSYTEQEAGDEITLRLSRASAVRLEQHLTNHFGEGRLVQEIRAAFPSSYPEQPEGGEGPWPPELFAVMCMPPGDGERPVLAWTPDVAEAMTLSVNKQYCRYVPASQPDTPAEEGERFDAKGCNEHGVAMCECGNKRPHAYEPGEWCGDRVIPKSSAPAEEKR